MSNYRTYREGNPTPAFSGTGDAEGWDCVLAEAITRSVADDTPYTIRHQDGDTALLIVTITSGQITWARLSSPRVQVAADGTVGAALARC